MADDQCTVSDNLMAKNLNLYISTHKQLHISTYQQLPATHFANHFAHLQMIGDSTVMSERWTKQNILKPERQLL